MDKSKIMHALAALGVDIFSGEVKKSSQSIRNDPNRLKTKHDIAAIEAAKTKRERKANKNK